MKNSRIEIFKNVVKNKKQDIPENASSIDSIENQNLSDGEKDLVNKIQINGTRVFLKKAFTKTMIKRYIICLLLIIVYILSFQSIKMRKDINYIPTILGNTYLNVLSDSMLPKFKVHDLVIGKVVKNSSKIHEGDIITFKEGGMLVTHRVMQVKDGGASFVTKGDANKAADEKVVTKENLVSRYRFHIPYFGYVAAKFQDFKFLGLIGLIFMYFIVKELIKEIMKKKKVDKQVSKNKKLEVSI
ncbi:signal peptidase I [Paludicola sp. MB14-C6]|uniref:signal peptidase I n=1 Tax=Paludihabitans sp. MB14-C6 TaxID=3070656 RepID=UPI0027DB9062|nr:signal peptidase I [Paludicola sp. MB14-C6]WMJ21944.1 signal peptidase I [Paludicola sp. MB14-C6]